MPAQRNESVERALSVLQSFSKRKTRLTLTELSRETELHKTTLLRLTRSLQLYGFLNRDLDGQFSLGASVWQLGLVFRDEFNQGKNIRPFLKMLVRNTGETASFYVRAGNDRVCLYRENSSELEVYGVDEGVRMSLDTGASGLVLRQFSGGAVSDEQRELFNSRFTVCMDGVRNPNIASIATPVFTPSGEFAGALTISGPKTRFDPSLKERYVMLVETAAEELRRQPL
ncbi:IclR family transcriptional regulator [Rhodobacteraceae bacterium RKSG542]|uniref:IclR family transcriptional regulator n=1 Tax=Pseudovibrio flavus TaxID=2529854 RepID=UPI0012BC9A01|nr:helix-turn-helix domain-containing protein [Pseudovibrio flavus]MTI17519.1 IclR family transcriptional regulator [Pseudovibrio flavus]